MSMSDADKRQKMFPKVVEMPPCPSCSAHAVAVELMDFGACLKCGHNLDAAEGYRYLRNRMEILTALVMQTAELAREAHAQTARIG
jgi:hypothetical protein